MSHQVTVPYVSSEVSNLLMWRDTKKSGIVFAVLLAVLVFPTSDIIFRCLGYDSAPPPLSCVFLGLTLIILVLNGWSIFAQTSGRVPPPLPEVFSRGVTPPEAQKFASDSLNYINPALGVSGRVLGGKDPLFAAKVVLGLLFSAWILSLISILTLLSFIVIAAFTIPKLYEVKKDDCDKIFGTFDEKYHELTGKVGDIIFKKAKTK